MGDYLGDIAPYEAEGEDDARTSASASASESGNEEEQSAYYEDTEAEPTAPSAPTTLLTGARPTSSALSAAMAEYLTGRGYHKPEPWGFYPIFAYNTYNPQ